MEIANKTVVVLRYIMKNSKGEELENIMESEPVKYLHGSGVILPQLESYLEGMKVGDKKSLSFKKENDSSSFTDEFHFDIIIDEVRMATKNELLTGKPSNQSQNDSCGSGCCC